MKITLREMLLLVLVVALVLGWLADRHGLNRKNAELLARNAELEGDVSSALMLCAQFGQMLKWAGCSIEWQQQGKRVIVNNASNHTHSNGSLNVDDFQFERARILIDR